METLPLVMRTIGAEMHRRHATELSAPQFHALRVIKDHDGASLSFVAKHLASGLPSSSKLIDGLVERGLITRQIPPEDRRRVLLSLTSHGYATLAAFHQEATAFFARQIDGLPEEEYAIIIAAMTILRRVFTLKATGAPTQGAKP
jgi:DNA-binding MarR family transcriptional regulator